jgi:hypothetical protein
MCPFRECGQILCARFSAKFWPWYPMRVKTKEGPVTIVESGGRWFIGRRGRSMAAGLITAFAAATWLTVVPSASAAPLCEQFGHVEVGGYVVQNNRWGTSSQQCIEVNGSGFVLTEQAGTSSTSRRSPTRPFTLAATTGFVGRIRNSPPRLRISDPCRAASASPMYLVSTTRRMTSGWTRCRTRTASMPQRS